MGSTQGDFKEEEKVCQLCDDMEVEAQEACPSHVGQNEGHNTHVFR